MPKNAKELSALEVKRLTHPGTGRNVAYAVGGVSGLLLQITPGNARSWLLRTTVGTQRREIGLGAYPEVTLALAREKARDMKEQIRQGVDPVEERKAARSRLVTAQRRGLTFSDAVDRYLAAKLDQFRNAKHRQQWRNTLDTYAAPELGKMLVQDIQVQDVLRTLEPIWQEKTETASGLRGRIESVLSWSTVAGHRTGDNPAAWKGNLSELLPAPGKVAKVANQSVQPLHHNGAKGDARCHEALAQKPCQAEPSALHQNRANLISSHRQEVHRMTGKELSDLRRQTGMTQAELARAVGIRRHAVSYWEGKPKVDLRAWAVRRMGQILSLPDYPTTLRARAPWGLTGNLHRKPVPVSRPASGLTSCGAKTRKGTACLMRPEPGKSRCRLHGGKSTGPKTPEGKARIAAAQRTRHAIQAFRYWRAG